LGTVPVAAPACVDHGDNRSLVSAASPLGNAFADSWPDLASERHIAPMRTGKSVKTVENRLFPTPSERAKYTQKS
jgi:hypothetical protein